MNETLWALAESWPHNDVGGTAIECSLPKQCHRCQLQAALHPWQGKMKEIRKAHVPLRTQEDCSVVDLVDTILVEILGVPGVKNG